MNCMRAPLRFFVAAVLVAAIFAWAFPGSAPVSAQDAMDQLENAANTGTLFDGSDGNRFGMDTEIETSGSVPDVSPPTAVDSSTDTATSQDASDDLESSDSADTSDNSNDSNDSDASDSEDPSSSDDSDSTDKTGTEKAE